MGIINRSREYLFRQSVETLRESGAITDLTPGGPTASLIDMHVEKIKDLYDQLSVAVSMADIEVATGALLDLKGESRGVIRLGARKAGATRADLIQKFYVNSGFLSNYIPSGFIPSGTQIVNDDGTVAYTVYSDTPFSPEATEVFVPVEALEAGADQNVGSNSLTNHNLSISQVFTTNVQSIDSGADVEDDESYRFRILAVGTSTTPGSEVAIRGASFNERTVSESRVVRHMQGVGTFGVEIVPVGNNFQEAALRNISNQVSRLTAYGNRPVIYTAYPVPICVVMNLKLADVTDAFVDVIVQTAESTVASIISATPRGGLLSVNALVNEVMNSSDTIRGVEILSLCIDGEEQAIRDYILDDDEYFVLDDKVIKSIQAIV